MNGHSVSGEVLVHGYSVRVAEWLRSPPLKQSQSDREGPGSIPGAGKLDSGFQVGEGERSGR